MSLIINIDMLPKEIRSKIHSYVKKLIKLYNENIISIFIYGSSTGRNYIPKQSDVNIAVVLKKMYFADLKKSLKLVSYGINKKISTPLFLTLKHIQNSTDVFPIEFFEMKDNNCLLYGQDLLRDIPIEEMNLRLQCEQQLRGSLIRIRQAYLEIGLNKKGLDTLLKESLNALFPVFRGLLRLKTKQSPQTDKLRILKSMGEHFNVDPAVFISILNDKKNDNMIQRKDPEIFLEKYTDYLQQLATAADEMKV